MSTYTVFISHAGQDTDVAKLLPGYIGAVGAICEIDCEFLEYGDNFQSKIRDKVKACDELLVLASRDFLEKPWLYLEIGMALNQGTRLALF